MKITLRHGLPPRLEDSDNFREFKLVAEGAPESVAPIGSALAAAGAGRVDETHAWISPAWLRSQKGNADDWEAGFQAMLAYAASKGWTDADGAVRAHIEWAPPTGPATA